MTNVQDKLLRKKEVLEMVSITNSTMYRMINNGQFPRPLRLNNENMDSGVRWKLSEINEFIDTRFRNNEILKNGVVTVDLNKEIQTNE